MATTTIIYQDDLSTEATHVKSENTLITDAPVDNNGLGRSFSPTDLVATALGSCILTVMGIKARDKGINMKGASVSVDKIMESNPRRIHRLNVTLTMPANGYSVKDRKILEATAHHCPVANSLKEGIEILSVIWLDDEQ